MERAIQKWWYQLTEIHIQDISHKTLPINPGVFIQKSCLIQHVISLYHPSCHNISKNKN